MNLNERVQWCRCWLAFMAEAAGVDVSPFERVPGQLTVFACTLTAPVSPDRASFALQIAELESAEWKEILRARWHLTLREVREMATQWQKKSCSP